MRKGRVKWFSESKGYGFIEIDGGRDIFVHYASIRKHGDRVEIGQVVEFDATRKDCAELAVESGK